MPPGPVFHLCAIQQVHAVCCLHNQVILNIPHLILVNNLWGRHFTQLQTHSSLLVWRNMSQLAGRDPNERLWQAHKQKTELHRDFLSSLIFLVVTSWQCFGPNSNPSSSDIPLLVQFTVQDSRRSQTLLFRHCFQTYARNCSYYTTASPVRRILLCTSDWWWQVLSTKQESISR